MTAKNYNLKWDDYFQLDANSPSGLVRIKNRVGKSIEKYNVGSKCFTKDGRKNAWSLRFQGELYYVHRIVWCMNYGNIESTLVIDHLDGNPFNNNISNLALKTSADNSRNSKRYKNNKTGITGVKLTANGNGYQYYEAIWNDSTGYQKNKCFSILKFGEEQARILAITYREKQIERVRLEGLNYTERHGTEIN